MLNYCGQSNTIKNKKVKSYLLDRILLPLEELVQELINEGKGDIGRLEHILSTLKKGQSLYTSDQDYLDKLLESKSIQYEQTKKESKITERYLEDIDNSIQSTDNVPSQSSEIKSLQKEIHKLQDKNHMIEEHLRIGKKSGSWIRAFGRGTGGVALFLFGLGAILSLYHFFSNLKEFTQGMYYGGDPMALVIWIFIVIPAILLIIGGSSIYYGIRLISKT